MFVIFITRIGIRKHAKHLTTFFWFRYETFYYLSEFRFFEENETKFLSMLTFPRAAPPPQTTGLALASSENRLPSSKPKSQLTRSCGHPVDPNWSARSRNQLAPSKSETQLTVFFFKSPKSSALPGMTSFTSPVLFPIWGFYCDISDCHIRPACA